MKSDLERQADAGLNIVWCRGECTAGLSAVPSVLIPSLVNII